MKKRHMTMAHHIIRVLCFFAALALIPLMHAESHAQNFAASVIGNYGDVTVMEVTGNYDTDTPEARTPREQIAKEFFKTHPDNYDFLIIFSDFSYKMPAYEISGESVTAAGFYIPVKNDVQGIGAEISDDSALFGSGKLQGFLEMGYLENIVSDPLEPGFEKTMTVLSHEFMHRWSAYVKYKKHGVIKDDLLGSKDLAGEERSHWSFLLDTSGSVLYGNRWHDNGNGTFTSLAGLKYYSPLDLYLMGLNEKSEVPPMLLIENPDIDRERMPAAGITIKGTPHYITIDDIIAAQGERIPKPSASQKDFRIGTILITRPGTFNKDELHKIRSITRGWTMWFSSLTDGKAKIRADAAPLENIPANPGIAQPPHTPRTLPGEINDGVAWLMNNQNDDGTWSDISQTTEKDTAEAVTVLKNFPIASGNFLKGIQWLAEASSSNTDYLSRQIRTLADSGEEITGLIEELVLRQNPDGGWGANAHYMSSPADTSLALEALAAASYSDDTVISPGIEYLKKEQRPDGSWGTDAREGSLLTTVSTLTAFSRHRQEYELDDACQNGLLWILGKQNPDGGFGSSPSTVYGTGAAISVLKEYNASQDIITDAVSYILNLQSEDGSWHESPYQTSLAVSAIWKASNAPDLSISTSDISFDPPVVTSLPAEITITAAIRNNGLTDVPSAKVALYDGPVSEANKLNEQNMAFPGKTSVLVNFTATITDGNAHQFYISVDPEGLVPESHRSDNTALKALYPETTCDFEILSSGISVSPVTADLLQTVTITSRITNRGTGDAFNVPLRYYADLPAGAYEIASGTTDIPAGKTVEHQATWKADRSGENLAIAAEADPHSAFPEISETNNTAFTHLTVTRSDKPNLVISHEEMTVTPSPAHEAGTAAISAIVINNGAAEAANVQVNFYKRILGKEDAVLGSRTIPLVSPGESASVSFEWTDIPSSGRHIITVQADPENRVQEIKEDDNSDFVTLDVLSLPDLVISSNSISFVPNAPKQGDTVSIRVSVVNSGEQEASDTEVTAYEGETLIGSKKIPLIPGGSQETAWFSHTPAKTGIHEIRVHADPGNAISEQNEENNTGLRNLGVRDTNLWLTQRFISPNGDGIQESTSLFFRLETPERVRIVVTSSKGEIVRIISGFENTTGGAVSWDGLDTNAMAVPDGEYKIQVLDENGTVLAGLPVTVDNNRSALADAVGTEYLLQTNLTCMVPDISHMQWFPDESGITAYVEDPDQDAPEYPTGLYTIAPDGSDPFRIVPPEWSKGNGAVYYTYEGQGFSLSPDGESIAFVLDKYDDSRPYSQKHELSQLRISDRYGENMVLLDSYDVQQDKKLIYSQAYWSPDSSHIACLVYDRNIYRYEVLIIKTDTAEKTVISPDISGTISNIKWSPDSRRLLYVQNNKAMTADLSGTRTEISDLSGLRHIEWLDNDRILCTQYSGIWLTDASGNGNHIKVQGSESLHYSSDDNSPDLAISPDRRTFAFVSDADWSVMLCDNTGKCELLYDLSSSGWHEWNGDCDNWEECCYECNDWISSCGQWYNACYYWGDNDACDSFYDSNCPDGYGSGQWPPSFSNEWYEPLKKLRWSRDGTRLAFIEGRYGSYASLTDSAATVSYQGGLAVISISSKEIFHGGKVSEQDYSCGHLPATNDISPEWLPDNKTVLAGNKVTDTEKNKKAYLPHGGTLSPLGRHITYYQDARQDSICYDRGSKDLWAMSSLLNLSADLRIARDKSALILKGTAADLNFSGYALEYADPENPDLWNPIMPPSNIPVVNDVFATWVPPHEGSFLVRLTVTDQAGNAEWVRKQAFWGLSLSMSNFYKSEELFSPDNDGVKDTVSLFYTVLEPVHSEFYVYDKDDRLVRTFAKDHAVPGNAHITWDGRDENGVTVPDGVYKIKVSDYEFFFEADNTPPDAEISLGTMETGISEGLGSGPLYIELSGLANDPNLETWVVEYGEGENPREWNEYMRGESALVKKDDQGNLIRDNAGNPLPGRLALFEDEDVGLLLSGKKFRITARDFAGNISTVVTGFAEERLVLFRWEKPRGGWHGIDFTTQGEIPGAYVKPGLHSLQGIYTIRMPMASASLQHRVGTEWRDGPETAELRSGLVSITWDNSDPDAKVSAVRIKVADLAGNEHFSNAVLVTNPLNIYYDCENRSYSGEALTLEELTLLRVQVRSGDPGEWTDILVRNAEHGDDVPEGEFEIWEPGHTPEFSRDDHIRLTGLGVSGEVYESDYVTYPPNCGGLSLEIAFQEPDECDALSDRAVLTAVSPGPPPGQLKSLSYYIQETGEFRLLRRLETWGSATAETGDMPEGSYPVKAVLEYVQDNVIMETEASATLTTDHVLPEPGITFPVPGSRVCPKWIQESEGGWYGIDVEGFATDNTRVKEYHLFYGTGHNPSAWFPANTRESDRIVQIGGEGTLQGRIGTWDITGLGTGTLSLMLRVTDFSGNVSCHFTSFAPDSEVSLTLQSDTGIISPNSDGESDSAEITFSVPEHAVVSLRVSGDSGPVRRLVSELPVSGSQESVHWDGTDDSGSAVPDGSYMIIASAEDSCGNIVEKRTHIITDTTPPETVISYPLANDSPGVVAEIRGTGSDLNFSGFRLEAVSQAAPDTPVLISEQQRPVQDGILGTWNNYGLEGLWTLRLTATDSTGNTAETSIGVNLGTGQNLIRALESVPRIFSPNNDGISDTVEIQYELNEECNVTLEIFAGDSLEKTYTENSVSPGLHSYSWDGTDSTGVTVPDGAYFVRLRAALVSDTSVIQTESITVTADSSAPVVIIQQPADQAFLKQGLTVKGSVTDQNLAEYSVTCTGDSGTIIIDKAAQNRENHTFGTTDSLDEGEYTLTVRAQDLGGNVTEKTTGFVTDRTPPKLALETPLQGEVYGGARDTVVIRGSLEERNPGTYVVRHGPGTSPDQWTELASGETLPGNPEICLWKTGKNDGIPDGLHTLSFYAKDKAGWETEIRRQIFADNTAPFAEITSPTGYFRGPGSDPGIIGTVDDANLEKYTVEISEGNCAEAFRWTPVRTSGDPVTNGVISGLGMLTADGDYCVRITAEDKPGNQTVIKHGFISDTYPPSCPVLSAETENRTSVRLTWTRGPEPDIAGYSIFRNGEKISTSLITGTDYLDTDLGEGTWVYHVKAADHAGWESEASNEARLVTDITGPDAKIALPREGAVISDVADIKGTAYSTDDFREYRVYVIQGSEKNLIRRSSVPISYDTLARWDTLGLARGQYSIMLEAEDISGNTGSHTVTVTVDNIAPAAPVLVSAVSAGSDAEITWQPNTESDLAGYLLFRNSDLANAPGTVTGTLAPYLLKGTAYKDEGLPDGTFAYYLVAADKAGNMSLPSETKNVVTDTHSPAAHITVPEHGRHFDSTLMIRADSADLDIAQVRFQYKKAGESTWTGIGSPIASQPFATYLSPAGLDRGEYNIRAVATDKSGKTDPSPSHISVTLTDLTAPGIPADLKAAVISGNVVLTWAANPESDLAGYNIWRLSGDDRTKLNPGIVTENTWAHQGPGGLADDEYSYVITSADRDGNESRPSEPVTATVRTPVIAQHYTPTAESDIWAEGTNAGPGALVEIFREISGVVASLGSVNADEHGAFAFSISLDPGENRITAQASDTKGNTGRVSDPMIVVHNQDPAAPTGLAGSVSGYDASLSWNPVTGTDMAGYTLYKDGHKVHKPVPVTSGTVSASGSSYNSGPDRAFDSSSATSWASPGSYDGFSPAWWEIRFDSLCLVSSMEIEWAGDQGADLWAGSDFEILVWSGHAWVTRVKVTGNESKTSTSDFSPAYRTDRIRIHITGTTYAGSYKHVKISELRIMRENLISSASYEDIGLSDGTYTYWVTRTDMCGFESLPSDEITLAVGDTVPPGQPPGLTATVSGTDVVLGWAGNTESDLAGYNLYRNTGQDWVRINPSLLAQVSHTDADLTNGTYAYRVTAEDLAGNESTPSEEAVADVFTELPAPPYNLSAVPVPEGSALEICWEHPGGTMAGFNLYRSKTPGGPYEKISENPITLSCYSDENLANGTAYYYVVAAADSVGNESSYSSEARAAPADSIAPPGPVMLTPAVSGIPYVSEKEKIRIAGLAEPGTTVRLYQNGSYTGLTTAQEQDEIQTYSAGYGITEASVSPDGKRLAYVSYNYLWIREVAGTSATRLAWKGMLPRWSPDSRRLAYANARDSRIHIYDTSTGKDSLVTGTGTGALESFPSWSPGGGKIVFVSNADGSDDIWVLETLPGTLVRITDGADAENPEFSPDCKRIAWLENRTLYVTDMGTGGSVMVSGDVSMHAWAPGTGKLGFIKTSESAPGIFSWDPDTEDITGIISGAAESFDWSPDGTLVAYVANTDMGADILIAPAQSGPVPRLVTQLGTGTLALANWIPTGDVFLMAGSDLHKIRLRGYFEFAGVLLYAGENLFHTQVSDSSGNTGSPSGDITVMLSPDLVPNLAVSEDDILIFPFSPTDGEETSVSVTVRNTSPADAYSADILVYVWNSGGEIEQLISETVEHMGPYSEKQISFSWESAGRSGENSVMVHADPDDTLREVSEADNFAVRAFFVASVQGDVSAEAATDYDWYYGGEDVNIGIRLFNSGPERDVVIEVSVTDESGETAAVADIINATLPYGLTNLESVWNTGYTDPGEYSVSVVLKDPGGVISQETAPFTIAPGMRLESSVTTDRMAYGPDTDVMMSISVTNTGQTIYIPLLNVRVRVTDSSGNELFTEERQIANLFSGSPVTLSSVWNTGSGVPGEFYVSAEVFHEGELACSAQKMFEIDRVRIIAGSVRAVPESVTPGTSVRAEHRVTNSGNASADGISLRVMVTDPETLAVISSRESVITLGPGETQTGESFFTTQDFAMGTYHAVLEYEYEGNTKILSSALFVVKDNTGPVITVISPAEAGTHHSEISLRISARDNASGTGRAEYRFDNGEWVPMFAPDPSEGTYINTLDLAGKDEGLHLIRFRAYDRDGNVSDTASVTVTVMHVPPFDRLTGVLTEDPDPVCQGLEAIFEYAVDNETSESFDNVIIRVAITDTDTQQVIKTPERVTAIPAGTTATGSFTVSTADISPGDYEAVLRIEKENTRDLDSTGFEVAASVEPNPDVPGPVSLLAWVNDKCGPDRTESRHRCVRTDLLETILREAATNYLIVYERDDFEKELRNPFHTDILILGDHRKLTGTYDEELTERVSSGTGLVSSVYRGHGSRNPLLGIRARGHLPNRYSVVHTLESAVCTEGFVSISEKADRIEASEGTATAGLIETESGSGSTYPGIVLNEYNRGKTVYYAFDLGLTLDDDNYIRIAELLGNSVRYVHRADDPGAFPWLFVSKGVGITGHGAFDARVTETFPDQFSLFDPGPWEWVTENPVITDIRTEQDETNILRYYFLLPDIPGTYVTETDIGIVSSGEYIFLDRFSDEIFIEKDTHTLVSDLIAELESLSVPSRDRSEIRKAIRELEDVREREIDDLRDIDRNIRDLIKAAESVMRAESTDMTDMRLKTDILLRIQESMYYNWGVRNEK